MCYSKYVRTGRESERRGRELEELIGELDLEVLNRSSDRANGRVGH